MGRGKSPFFYECLFWSADCVAVLVLAAQKVCEVLEVLQSCPALSELCLGRQKREDRVCLYPPCMAHGFANLNTAPGFHPVRIETHLNNIP